MRIEFEIAQELMKEVGQILTNYIRIRSKETLSRIWITRTANNLRSKKYCKKHHEILARAREAYWRW
jgi:hypothetical protein